MSIVDDMIEDSRPNLFDVTSSRFGAMDLFAYDQERQGRETLTF
jgi:hypothetical protein